MPATYAHYRLGQEVLKALNPKEKDLIHAFPQVYQIGLHGPDILFYYKPIHSNDISGAGYAMHERAGRCFFEDAANRIRTMKNQAVHLSYIYGFLCHFSLDVCCHGYVAEKMRKSGLSHSEVETEFDRYLMTLDGIDPVSSKTTTHIHPSAENAEVIADFFPQIENEEMLKALKGMVFYLDMLVAPSKLKRNLIFAVLKVSGNYRGMHGLVVSYKPNPECEDSNVILKAHYDEAVTLAIRLIHEFQGVLEQRDELDSVFDYNFEGQLTKVQGSEITNEI